MCEITKLNKSFIQNCNLLKLSMIYGYVLKQRLLMEWNISKTNINVGYELWLLSNISKFSLFGRLSLTPTNFRYWYRIPSFELSIIRFYPQPLYPQGTLYIYKSRKIWLSKILYKYNYHNVIWGYREYLSKVVP